MGKPDQAIYQKPNALVLGVIHGELPVALTILAQRWLTVGRWRLGFHIIGESHFVRIETAGAPPLHEVLACVDLPAAQLAHHHEFTDLTAHTYQAGRYQVEVDFTGNRPMPKNALFMQLEFPQVYGQIPLTQIHLEQTRQTVRWWTLHLYPELHNTTKVQTVSTWRTMP